MTSRTDVQANCIDAYAAKTGTTDKSVTPTVVSEFLQVLADNAAMVDELQAVDQQVLDIVFDLQLVQDNHCQLGNTTKTNGEISLPITGTGTEDLFPPDNPQPVTGGDYNGYVKVLGLSSISTSGAMTIASSEITVGVAGDYYSSHAYLDLSSNLNSNNVGFVVAVERSGFFTFSERAIGARAANGDDRTNVAGGGFFPNLLVGDKLSIWVASEKDTTLTVFDANLGINLRKLA
tara:strand:+ start:1381 stop:2082 length:702 start_codon:yes stop_codon:yes gene_type:complete